MKKMSSPLWIFKKNVNSSVPNLFRDVSRIQILNKKSVFSILFHPSSITIEIIGTEKIRTDTFLLKMLQNTQQVELMKIN
jgi:hypothetical protein